jgi:hypothetical protein
LTPEGEVELRSEYMESGIDEAEHPEERGLLYIEPIGSGESYRDLEDFIELVTDRRARPAGARDRRSWCVQALQGHALRVPRAQGDVVPVSRHAHEASRDRVAR